MATVRANYKRTFQTRPYETQVIELAIEVEVPPPKSGALATAEQAACAEKLYRTLDQLGDTLMRDALAKPDPAGRR